MQRGLRGRAPPHFRPACARSSSPPVQFRDLRAQRSLARPPRLASPSGSDDASRDHASALLDAPRDGPDVAVYWDVRRERSDSSMSVPPEMDVAAVPREYAGGDSVVCPA